MKNLLKKDNAPLIEWEFHEDENDWHDALVTRPLAPGPNRHWWRRWGMVGSFLLLILLMSSGWLWYRAEVGLAQVNREMLAAVEAELWTTEQHDPLTTLYTSISQTPQAKVTQPGTHPATIPPAISQLQVKDLGKDWAVVEMIIVQAGRSYHQTRAYRLAEGGWYRATPTTALWGAPATLETEFFIFHYYAHDAEAVQATTALLDALVPTLTLLGLIEFSQDAKWSIHVSPEQPLNDASQVASTEAKLTVLSPALYLAPLEISEEELLAQAIILQLLDALSAKVVDRYTPVSQQNSQASAQLESLLYSLRLWEAWRMNLPLAALGKPVVQWIYSDAQHSNRPLPAFDPALCERHNLWAEAPFMFRVPLFCDDPKQVDHLQLWNYLHTSPWRLTDLTLYRMATPTETLGDLAAVVGLATVLDYASHTYGHASVAQMVANSVNASSWETLIPMTFDVTVTVFETGWQNHLREHFVVASRKMR